MTTDWKKNRDVRLLVLSATQIETFQLCKRKWWNRSVRKLVDPTTSSQAFGTVLHGVNERYLRADALGRDEKGNLVELYPEGWTKALKRHPKVDEDPAEGEVTPAEASVIQMLVQEAIESGILERIEERAIEAEFREEITTLPCPECKGVPLRPVDQPCDVCHAAYGTEHNLEVHEIIANQLATDGDDPEFAASILDPGPWTCPTCGGDGKGTRIQIVGYIDYMTPEGIQDHKTTKNMRWAKSKEALKSNVQMLLYAKILLNTYRDQGRNPPEKISLRHNVFCKDPNDLRVRKTEVFVTPEDIETFWTGLKETAIEMEAIRRTANGWHEIPPPASFAHACNAYGGCPYRLICDGKESEEMYEKRLDRQQSMRYIHSGNPNDLMAAVAATYKEQLKEESSKMSLAEIMRQKSALASSTGAPASPINPPASVPTQTTPAQAPVPVNAPAVNASLPQTTQPAPASGDVAPPPWANPACTACKGLGFNSQGNPCRICDMAAMRATPQRPSSGQYTTQVIENGECVWQSKTDPNLMGVSKMVSAGPVQAQSQVQAPTPVRVVEASVTAPVVPTGVPVVPGTPITPPVTPPAPAKEAKEETRGRPRKGFTLVLNGNVTKGGGRNVTRLLDVFHEIQKDLGGQGSYFDLDPFKRRDTVAAKADQIADGFGTDLVCADVSNGTPDFKAFVEAVRAYAGVEIVCSA